MEVKENKIQYNVPDKRITPVTSTLYVLQRPQIISDFSSATSYSPGDIVYRGNFVYRCIVAHTGAWSNNDFTQVVLADEIHSDIVTISATGVQSDEMDLKIRNAKALVYGNTLYHKFAESSSTINFKALTDAASASLQIRNLTYTISTKTIQNSTSNYNRVSTIGGAVGSISLDYSLSVDANNVAKLTGKLPYLNQAPTADNTSGFLTIVVLSAEPTTRYNGYLYIITAAAA